MNKVNMKYILVLVILLISGFSGCKGKAQVAVKEKPIPVKVVPVTRRTMAVPIHTSGRLMPGELSKLSFKTGGIIKTLAVDEGDTVKKGQRLASLDLAEVKAYHKKAENGYKKAVRDHQRVQNLYKDRAATLEQLQDVKTALDVAKANLEIAGFNLKHSKILAPTAGKILNRLAEPNEIIAAGHPVYLFGSTDNRWVVDAGVNLRELVKIRRGNEAKITFDAYPARVFDAIITEISEAVDRASGTCPVELELMEPGDLKLVAGFIAAVDIFPAGGKEYLMIPIDALVEAEGSEGFVFVVQKGKAKKVKVSIAHLQKESALAVAQSNSPTQVVTHGSAYLTDGSAVQVVNPRHGTSTRRGTFTQRGAVK